MRLAAVTVGALAGIGAVYIVSRAYDLARWLYQRRTKKRREETIKEAAGAAFEELRVALDGLFTSTEERARTCTCPGCVERRKREGAGAN